MSATDLTFYAHHLDSDGCMVDDDGNYLTDVSEAAESMCIMSDSINDVIQTIENLVEGDATVSVEVVESGRQGVLIVRSTSYTDGRTRQVSVIGNHAFLTLVYKVWYKELS